MDEKPPPEIHLRSDHRRTPPEIDFQDRHHSVHSMRTYASLPNGWTVEALSPFVQFRHDDILRLTGTCLSREIDERRLVHRFVALAQQVFDNVGGLARTGRTNNQHRFLMGDQHVHERGESNRVQRFDDNLVEERILGNSRNAVQLMRPRFPVLISFLGISGLLSSIFFILQTKSRVRHREYNASGKEPTGCSQMNL